MSLIWLFLVLFMMWVLFVDLVWNSETKTEKSEPIDISDPDGEDKWGAM